jgi:drug/metabolite transporter (DMT)-like permease
MAAEPAPIVRPIDGLAVASLIACCAIWGVNQVAMKVANTGIDPMLQAAVRSVLAGLLLLAWAGLRGIRLFDHDRTLWAGLAVGLTFGANFLCIGPGLSLTEASRGVLFLYSAPFFVAAAAHFLFPSERLSGAKGAGLILAFAGLVFSVSDRLGADGGREMSLAGDLLCLSAGFFWALTTIIIRLTPLARAAPEKTLLYQLAFSAPVLFAGAWITGETVPGSVTPLVAAAFAYSVVLVVFASYAVWFWLLRTYPAAEVSAYTFLGPVFAVLAGAVLLGEPITWRHGVALVLIAIGLVLVSRPAKRLPDRL